MLTIISVKFGSGQWLEKNLELCRTLNQNAPVQWLIVNNDNNPNFLSHAANVQILPGVARASSQDKGSYHHAAAIMKALPQVQTRFLLLLDHDFYVLMPNWMERITQHMDNQKLHFFGSVWHPKWSYQYRYFPSVHFMIIDLEQVKLTDLDFTPDMGANWFDNLISSPKFLLPKKIRTALQIGQFRDTGWRVYQQFLNAPNQCLVPHWLAQANPFLPDRLSVVPQQKNYFTNQSFLQTDSGFAYQHGWEEFFWQDQPFAVHLRRVGRNPNVDEYAELCQLLEQTTP